MSEIQPKPPEIQQAQLAAFAAETIAYSEDRAHVFNNLGDFALGEATEIVRTTGAKEYENTHKLPVGEDRIVATSAAFTDYLREVGGQDYVGIKDRAELLSAYDTFSPKVAKLREELSDPAQRFEHPAFLGQGGNALAFSIREGDKDYAVRVPKGSRLKPDQIDRRMAAAILGKDIPRLEKIVASSYEDGVTIAEMMPGREIGTLTADEITQITDQQLTELVDTLTVANQRGIEIDPKPSNFFYDPEQGFGIIDYSSSRLAGKTSAGQTTGTVVGWMATVIGNAGFYGNRDRDTSQDHAVSAASHDVMERYRAIVATKLSEEEAKTALAFIDARLQTN